MLFRFAKLSLINLLTLNVKADHVQRYITCRSICKDYLNTNHETNVCQGAINIMPKPFVHKACMKGKLLGFEHACMSSCTEDMMKGSSDGSSYEACKSLKNKPLPNHQFPWCRRGYDDTYNRVTKRISELTEFMFGDIEGIDNTDDSTNDGAKIKKQNNKYGIVHGLNRGKATSMGEVSMDQKGVITELDTKQDEGKNQQWQVSKEDSSQQLVTHNEEIAEESFSRINVDDHEIIESSYGTNNKDREKVEEATYNLYSNDQKMEEEHHYIASVDSDNEFGHEAEKEQYGGIANTRIQNLEENISFDVGSDSLHTKYEPHQVNIINHREKKEESTIDNAMMEGNEVQINLQEF